MKEDKWDKLNKELDDALDAEFGSEEPKQESVFENAKSTLRKHLFDNKAKVARDLEQMREWSNDNKQETLEEAAEKYAEGKSSNPTFRNTHIRDFKAGADWQAERMYSQDEILMAMGYAIGVSGRGSLSHEEVKASCIDFVERLNKK